jgi:tetratricopeptide (TPR) repeat protein
MNVRAVIICALFVAEASAAHATQAEDLGRQWEVCENRESKYSDALVAASCTAVIQSEHVDPEQLMLALNNRGLSYHNQQDYDRAIADFDRAIELNPQFAAVYNNRANARLKSNEYAAALTDLDEAIRLDSTMASAFELRGDYFYYGARDYERALLDYDEAVRLAPDVAHFRNSACWVRAANLRRDLQRAEQECDAAVRLSGGDPNDRNSRGLVYLKVGRFEDAWSDYNAAVVADASDAHSLYGRGLASLGLGQLEQGRVDLQASEALDPSVAQEYASYGVGLQ